MDGLERIIPYIISLQNQLNNSSVERLQNTDLTKLLEIAENFRYSVPVMTVDTINDEVIVTGTIPMILKPEDVSIKLNNGVILHIECLWHKSIKDKRIAPEPQRFKKRIELPFCVDPVTVKATYQNRKLQISAKKLSEERLTNVKVKFLD
ncbi:MAG: hypothetical protein VR69_03430 [Peptococcaceae bacterium BRH_c4b]|nr:MAG: hypothetical protein VR69_03430 [Peptococcaceae bacterium BRH_c4b]